MTSPAQGTRPVELQTELDAHAELTRRIGEWQEEWKGKTPAAEDVEKVDKMIADLDAVETKMEAIIKDMERGERIASRLRSGEDYLKKSRGLLPGLGGTAADPERKSADEGLIEFKGGRGGVTVNGQWFDLAAADAIKADRQIMATNTAQYKTAWQTYLRSGGVHYDTKDLSEGVDTAGGYLAPPDFVAQVIQRLPGVAYVEDRAQVRNTTRDRVEIPRMKASTTDTTMYSSAVRFTMVGETPTEGGAATEPAYEMLGVTVWTAMLETELSRNLIADSAFDVTGFLVDEYRRAATLGKEDKYLTGTGAFEPLGIMNDPDITSKNSGHASNVTADGWIELIFDLPQQYRPGAIVLMSRDCRKKTAQLKAGDGSYLFDFGESTGRIGEGRPGTILGEPYGVTDFLDSVSAGTYPALYGNLAFFWAFNRLALSVQVLREQKARNNQDVYLAFLRFTGSVTVPEAYRKLYISA